MYILIVGCGIIGSSLAKALVMEEHEVLVIDKDITRCEKLEEDLGSITVNGDGCEADVLSASGINRADLVIAVTGSDADNLVSCQLAKHLFNVPKAISLINNPANTTLFKLLNVDVTVSSTDLILSHIEEELPAHGLVHLMPLTGTNRALVQIKIPPDAKVVGKCLKDLTLPDGTLVSMIITETGDAYLANNETVIEGNGDLIALTNTNDEDALWATLTESA